MDSLTTLHYVGYFRLYGAVCTYLSFRYSSFDGAVTEERETMLHSHVNVKPYGRLNYNCMATDNILLLQSPVFCQSMECKTCWLAFISASVHITFHFAKKKKKRSIGRCKGLLSMSQNLLITFGCEIKYSNSRASVSWNMWQVTKFLA